MKFTLPGCLLLLATCPPVYAEAIDLQCEELAKQMIERFTAEGLLASSAADVQQRARALGNEQDKQKALDNWFMEATGDKPGNKRLKNFKR